MFVLIIHKTLEIVKDYVIIFLMDNEKDEFFPKPLKVHSNVPVNTSIINSKSNVKGFSVPNTVKKGEIPGTSDREQSAIDYFAYDYDVAKFYAKYRTSAIFTRMDEVITQFSLNGFSIENSENEKDDSDEIKTLRSAFTNRYGKQSMRKFARSLITFDNAYLSPRWDISGELKTFESFTALQMAVGADVEDNIAVRTGKFVFNYTDNQNAISNYTDIDPPYQTDETALFGKLDESITQDQTDLPYENRNYYAIHGILNPSLEGHIYGFSSQLVIQTLIDRLNRISTYSDNNFENGFKKGLFVIPKGYSARPVEIKKDGELKDPNHTKELAESLAKEMSTKGTNLVVMGAPYEKMMDKDGNGTVGRLPYQQDGADVHELDIIQQIKDILSMLDDVRSESRMMRSFPKIYLGMKDNTSSLGDSTSILSLVKVFIDTVMKPLQIAILDSVNTLIKAIYGKDTKYVAKLKEIDSRDMLQLSQVIKNLVDTNTFNFGQALKTIDPELTHSFPDSYKFQVENSENDEEEKNDSIDGSAKAINIAIDKYKDEYNDKLYNDIMEVIK